MSSAAEVAADLVGLALQGREDVDRIVVKHGYLVLALARRNASQPRTATRPRVGPEEGPRALTGSFRASMNVRFERTPVMTTAHIGTNDPRGTVLEYGFEGVDSAGRHRHQQSYPSFGPALKAGTAAFEADLLTAGVPRR
jgi:hypothetical protein